MEVKYRPTRHFWVFTIVILSVRPSVLLSRPCTDSSPGEIDSGFLLYDSVESLVSCEQISCRWVWRFPSNKGIKQGYPLKIVISSLLARLARERLQIDTDLLRIVTSSADELSGGTNIDDLKRPWTPKIGVLVNFSRFQAATHTWRVNFRRNYWR